MTIDHRLHRAARELRELEIETQPFSEVRAERARPTRRMASVAPVLIAVTAALGAFGVLTTTGAPGDEALSDHPPITDAPAAIADVSESDGSAAGARIDASTATITAREELNLIRNASADGLDAPAEDAAPQWATGGGRRIGGPS